LADFLNQELVVPTKTSAPAAVEFVSPRTKPYQSRQISPTRGPWDGYTRRRPQEIFEEPLSNLYAIHQGVQTDGYIKQTVTKFTNGIFLRGYKILTLKPAIDKYLKVRLRLIIDADPKHDHIDALFQDIARDLVTYANVYLYKNRRKQPTLPKGVNVKGVPAIKQKGKEDQKPILVPQDPIAAYELLHPATMRAVRDPNNNVIRYEQWPWGAKARPQDPKQRVEFTPDEIIHITTDREDGFAYGAPFLGPVLDDVRMLRTIEDHTSRLAFRFAFPFTQVRVGEPTPGFQATEEQLDYYKKLVANAPPDATLVTSESVEFNVVGAEGEAINLEPYLEHFQNRSFSGLGVSGVAMGQGDTANRSTADAMSVEMHDQIKHFQNVLSRSISQEIFREILQEGGFELYEDIEKNWAELIFEEIEVESQIKREAHNLALLQANALTFSEFRKRIGLQPFTEAQWDDTYLTRFLIPQDIVKLTGTTDLEDHGKIMLQKHKADMNAAADLSDHSDMDLKLKQKELDAPPEQGAAQGAHAITTTKHAVTTGGGKRTVAKTTQVKKPVAAPKGHFALPPGPSADPKTTSKGTDNKNRPANQHGKRLGPKRKGEGLFLSEDVSAHSVDMTTSLAGFYTEIGELFEDLRGASIEQGQLHINMTPEEEPQFSKLLFELVKGRILTLSQRYLQPAFHAGVARFWDESELPALADPFTSERAALTEFNERTVNRLVGDLARPTIRAIKNTADPKDLPAKVNAIFDGVRYRLEIIANTELPQSYWFGYASAAHLTGVPLQLAREAECCDECLAAPDLWENQSSARRRLSAAPTLHPRCECSLVIRLGS
jgi:hypothetical protein